jgi:anti-sigma regulatory factor (Ser/Thr protein kinase)
MGVNAMEWGHRKRVELVVTVKYRIEANRVVVTVKDTGPGFNRQTLTHAADIEDPMKHIDVRESLGLARRRVRHPDDQGLVDEMEYNQTGNEVRLVKYFNSKPAESSP